MGAISRVLPLSPLAALGWLLISPPLLPAMPRHFFGFPVTAIYLFAACLGLVSGAQWILAAGRRSDG